MGSVYRRKGSVFLWLGYVDANNHRRLVSSKTADEAEARAVLALLERQAKAEKASGLAKAGPVTVRAYAAKWIEARKLRNVASADDDAARLRHAVRQLGSMPLKEVRHRHVLSMVRGLQEKGELAPRSIRHVHSTLRVMFGEALIQDLVAANPCTLTVDRGELPGVEDKDPAWRDTAVFARDEVETLISAPSLTERQRVLNGLLFLGGFRINEVTPRAWREYDAAAKPLGMLRVATSFSRKRKVVKAGTKTGPARLVPVHPTLASLLAGWKLGGWERTYGRPPGPEDFILPNQEGGRLDCVRSLTDFHRDLDALGLRRRRQHDARRTFISLALADGARKEVLKRVTHGARGDVMDLYNTVPWPTLCEEVAKLNIRLLGGRVLALTGTATAKLQPSEGAGMTTGNALHGTGLEGVQLDASEVSATPTSENSEEEWSPEDAESPDDTSGCSTVADYEERARAAGFSVIPERPR